MVKLFLCVTLLLIAAPAHAMHISEGILPLPWAASGTRWPCPSWLWASVG